MRAASAILPALLAPLVALAAPPKGDMKVFASRALEVAGMGRSFVTLAPQDAVDGPLPARLAGREAGGEADRGAAAQGEGDGTPESEFERCWAQYEASRDAAAAIVVGELSRVEGRLIEPEPGTDGAKRVAAAIGEMDIAVQRLLADGCLPESARRTLLRRAMVRILADGRYRHDLLHSATAIDAGLELERPFTDPPRLLCRKLESDAEVRAAFDETLTRYAETATELRRTAMGAHRSIDAAAARGVSRTMPEDWVRDRRRLRALPRTWWREQTALLDAVLEIAVVHGAEPEARRWRITVIREAFPSIMPTRDLEDVLRAARIDPAAVEVEGWMACWAAYMVDRDRAALALADRGLAFAEAADAAVEPPTPWRNEAALRTAADTVLEAGRRLIDVEAAAATRAAELLAESDPDGVVAVLTYLSQLDRPSAQPWKRAVEAIEKQAAARAAQREAAGHAPDPAGGPERVW